MIELAEVLCVFSQLAIGGCPPPPAPLLDLWNPKKRHPQKRPFSGPTRSEFMGGAQRRVRADHRLSPNSIVMTRGQGDCRQTGEPRREVVA